jgi:hypothetical protein
MRLRHRSLLATALLASAVVLAACNDESTGNDTLNPPANPAAASVSPTVIRITFDAVSGATSYEVERVQGTQGGTFAQIGTTPSTQYDDDTVDPSTTYRYRVRAVKNGQAGTYTNEILVTSSNPGNVDVTADLAANTTWTRDNVYTLKGFIHVLSGATLTIEAGTKIQGDFNTLGSSLFVLKGARIMAVGTADQPIVFTSSRAPGSRQPGDWGGLIIVGKAPVNRAGNIEVEGTGTSASNFQVIYSGDNAPDDNSGELKYVRVEFAGYAPSVNNELNAFTFAAVGSGTKVSYLQAMAGLDDSFEFFGGGFDGRFLVSYEAGDDNFDMSEGFSGRLQYLISLNTTVLTQRAGAGSPASDPEGIENDGCAGAGCTNGFDTAPFTVPLVANFTLVGTGDPATSGSSGGIGMMIRRGSGGYYVNGIVARYPRAGVSIRDNETFARAQSQAIPDPGSAATLLALRNILFLQVPKVFDDGSSALGAVFDLAGNSLTNDATATVQTLFTAFPGAVNEQTNASAFDWTPANGSPAANGGLATLPGVIGTKGGTVVTGTAFVGAAPPAGQADAKWWDGWTVYTQK